MTSDEKLPRLSFDLIKWLDESVPVPPWPSSAKGIAGLDDRTTRTLAFLAGQRYMVDVLIALMNEELRGDDEGSSDGPPRRFARILSADGDVHSIPVSDVEDMDR